MAKLNKKTILALLDKLSPEAKAISPIVKQGTEAGERLVTESQLAPSQKIVERLPSSEEYAQKINSLRRAAGIAGAIGASSLISQEEAEAAGVETIMRKLGVGLEEAAKIKELALKKLPNDIFEENIKAIQTVSQYKKDPNSFKKIGSGVDFRALDIGNDKVLKVPKDLTTNDDIFKIAPGLMEQAELGPKTKIISTNNKSYMVQDKVTPSTDIFKGVTRHDDKILDDISREIDSIWKDVNIDDPVQVTTVKNDPRIKQLEQAYEDRKLEIYKERGFDVNSLLNEYQSIPESRRGWVGTDEQQILTDPETSFENIMQFKANEKVGNVITPLDLHSANIGFDLKGNPIAFDTSRFKDFKPNKISNAQRDTIINSNIALPEKKKALANLLSGNPDLSMGDITDIENKMSILNNKMRELVSKSNALPYGHPDDLVIRRELDALDKEFSVLRNQRRNLKNFNKNIAGVGAAPIASMNPQEVLMNKPLESIKDAYTSIRKPVLDATRKVGEFISDKVRIPGVLTEEQKQYERDLAGSGAEMILDPANALAPGAGLAMGAADIMLYKPEEEPQETPEEIQARIKREQLNNLRLK